MTKKRIAVIGDIALDFAYFISPSAETSVETGLSVNEIKKYTFDTGAAANLATNFATLGLDCDLYGVIGNDEFGRILLTTLKAYGVETEHIVKQQQFNTFVYHKFYSADGTEQNRCDIGNQNRYNQETLNKLIENIRINLEQYDAIVINEQFTNTLHNSTFKTALVEVLSKYKGHIWIDSRNGIRYPNASVKLNKSELFKVANKENLKEATDNFLAQDTTIKSIVVTLGKEGAYYKDKNTEYRVLGINDVKKTDPVGAGDAFLAGLVSSLVEGKTINESLEFANANATVSALTLYATGHPTLSETNIVLSDIDYRYNPDLAKDQRKAKYLDNTEIEIITNSIKTQYPKVAIFDHDGTISTMRHGWEKIMRKMMVEAIAGNSYYSLPQDKIEVMYRDVDEMIEKTTGIQTIIQMSQLIEIIKEYGYVKEKDIKTPLEYKNDYRRLLNKQLECKYERFNDGIYKAQDLTMSGALAFLKELNEHKTKVFLASGSDYTDVQFETHTLGYDKYFTGGIYGSVSDLSKDPKKMVMGEIIKKIDAASSDVVVFGDGPVEIREAKKHGFLAIGIISDEHQRFGMNLKKRERLILAGADILIPDFSWMKKLEDYLGWTRGAEKNK